MKFLDDFDLQVAYDKALNEIVTEEIAKYPTYSFLNSGHEYYIRTKLSLLNTPLIKIPLIIKKFSQYAPYVITQDVNAFMLTFTNCCQAILNTKGQSTNG